MHAAPIIPGKAYRVKFQGRTVEVLARNGVDAMRSVLHLVEGL